MDDDGAGDRKIACPLDDFVNNETFLGAAGAEMAAADGTQTGTACRRAGGMAVGPDGPQGGGRGWQGSDGEDCANRQAASRSCLRAVFLLASAMDNVILSFAANPRTRMGATQHGFEKIR